MLVRVLVAAGKAGDALAVGHDLVGRFTDHPDRRADLSVVLARAALTAGDTAATRDRPGASRRRPGHSAGSAPPWQRYGVPVHRSDVPPRFLAALLGADRALADRLRLGPDVEVQALLAAPMADWTDRWRSGRPATAPARRPRLPALGRSWRGR